MTPLLNERGSIFVEKKGTQENPSKGIFLSPSLITINSKNRISSLYEPALACSLQTLQVMQLRRIDPYFGLCQSAPAFVYNL